MRLFLKNVALAIDQTCNALVGGSPDETLSAHAHRRNWALRHFINLLFLDRNHCKASYEAEMNREHLPKEYRA